MFYLLIICLTLINYSTFPLKVNIFLVVTADEQEVLNSIMQDLAELHRSSRPATFLSDLGKPKVSSPKNQVKGGHTFFPLKVLSIFWTFKLIVLTFCKSEQGD